MAWPSSNNSYPEETGSKLMAGEIISCQRNGQLWRSQQLAAGESWLASVCGLAKTSASHQPQPGWRKLKMLALSNGVMALSAG